MPRYKKAYVEITNVCNLSCEFCPKTTRPPRFMSADEFAALAKQIKPLCDYIYLHVMGEPLLHPQLADILKICEIMELNVTITTNGTLIKKQSDTLLNAPYLYKAHFSLHSFEVNESSVTLAQYLRDIAQFVKQAADEGTINVLRLWNMDDDEIKGANRLNKDIIDILEDEFASAFSLRNALCGGRTGIKLAPRVYLETAQKFAWPSLAAPALGDEVFCYGLRDQFGILADGTVAPCCLDSEGTINLGNALEKPLKSILQAYRARRVYEGFTARKAAEELCRHCGYARRF